MPIQLQKLLTKALHNSFDGPQTPAWALDYLTPFLSKTWLIWEPACGKGSLVNGLRVRGFRSFGSDILEGKDFLCEEPEHWDCLVTNPPYSIKTDWIKRCYSLKKPFALLLPWTALETEKRQRLFRENGLEIIGIPERIHFELPGNPKKKTCWFATNWFTWGLKIGRDLTFMQRREMKDANQTD